jgi:hypothetical protein
MATEVFGFTTVLVNNCRNTIFWRAAAGLHGDRDQMAPLGAGHSVLVNKPPQSLSVKVNKSNDWASVLQAEVTLDAPGAGFHYNWSDDNGNDFGGDLHGIYPAGGTNCKDLVCQSNDNSCNYKSAWPLKILTCHDPGRVEVRMCSPAPAVGV